MSPGSKGTCWCCGAVMKQDVTELCLDCETVRMEVWSHAAERAKEEREARAVAS